MINAKVFYIIIECSMISLAEVPDVLGTPGHRLEVTYVGSDTLLGHLSSNSVCGFDMRQYYVGVSEKVLYICKSGSFGFLYMSSTIVYFVYVSCRYFVPLNYHNSLFFLLTH